MWLYEKRVFRSWLDLDESWGWIPSDGISDLIRRGDIRVFSLPLGLLWERGHLHTRKRTLTKNHSCWLAPGSWPAQSSEPWEWNVWFWSGSVCGGLSQKPMLSRIVWVGGGEGDDREIRGFTAYRQVTWLSGLGPPLAAAPGACPWAALDSRDLMCVCSVSTVRLFVTSMDCSPAGRSVHRVLQARILEWIAMPSSRGIFLTWGLNSCLCVSRTAGGFFTTQLPEKPPSDLIGNWEVGCEPLRSSPTWWAEVHHLHLHPGAMMGERLGARELSFLSSFTMALLSLQKPLLAPQETCPCVEAGWGRGWKLL